MGVNLDRDVFVAAFDHADEWPSLYIDSSTRQHRLAVIGALRDAGWMNLYEPFYSDLIQEGSMITVRMEPIADVEVNLMPDDQEVALTFDIKEMKNQAAVDAVSEVARTIGRASGMTVSFAVEAKNQTDPVILYHPESDAFEVQARNG